MNVLIAIGCDNYSFMSPLKGAESDAKAIFDLLTGPGDPYSRNHSVRLASPSLVEVREALNRAFPLQADCDGLTFFFAGHGEVAGGNFYLCLSDSEGDKLSTTAYAIHSLFSIVNEFKPAQVNIVIDACRAGGSSFDLGNLIKSEVTGSSTSSSVVFLGACGADQYALESNGQGALTGQLLRTLRGEIEVQRRSPLLDLVEVGAVVSPLVQDQNTDQRPLAWGLSLFGGSRFARNPFYSDQGRDQHFPLPDISPFSPFGQTIRGYSEELWEIHREIPNGFKPRRLLTCLDSIVKNAQTSEEKIALVKGLGASLSSRAVESDDLLAPWLCLATSLVALLPNAEEPIIEAYLPGLLTGLFDRSPGLQKMLLEAIGRDRHYLLSSDAVAGDLYYLPLRLTRLLGWLGLEAMGWRYLKAPGAPPSILRELCEELISRHGESLTAVSDEQGAPLYVFLLACRNFGWEDLAKQVLTAMYASFCDRQGNTTRCDIPVEQAVRYVLSLTQSLLTPRDWRPANPSHLLPILLIGGESFGLAGEWELCALDGVSMNFFLPQNPRNFSQKVIEHGVNHVYQTGFGVWKIDEFMQHFKEALREARAGRNGKCQGCSSSNVC